MDQRSVETRVLRVVAEVFERFHAGGVRYCHWKSNEHFLAGAAGRTDLDVLVDRAAVLEVTQVLAAAGFKRFQATSRRVYPAVEDYLGMDPDTGTLIHVHLHFRLVLGEQFLKGFRLPWEECLLASRHLDETGTAYVADPNVELLLLLVRAALKLRWRDTLLALLGGRHFGWSMLAEFEWLRERIDRERLKVVASELIGERAANLLPGMVGEGPAAAQLRVFRDWIEPPLDAYRTYPPAVALGQRWAREVAFWWGKARRRLIRIVPPSSTPTKRVIPHGGFMVAVLGTDGSGKSTITQEIARWLDPKLDVFPVYLGSGKGKASLVRGLLRRLAQRVSRPRAGVASLDVVHPGQGVVRDLAGTGRRPGLRAIWFAVWGLVIAAERRQRLQQAQRARNLGLVVISDRYPQSQVSGYNDGPLLAPWLDHPSRLLRAAARREREVFRLATAIPPDLVLKLQVRPDVAARRRPETNPEMLHRKADGIAQLRFPAVTRVVDIDANQPLEAVLLDVKRAIWALL